MTELKNLDLSQAWATAGGSMVAPSSASTGAPLVGLAQGTSAVTRIGRKVRVQQVTLNGTLNFAPLAGTVPTDLFSWALLLDTQANGAYPAIGDVYSTPAANQTLENMDEDDRFVTLCEGMQHFDSSAGASGAYASQVRRLRLDIPVDVIIEYQGAAGAIAEIRSNNLLFVYGSTNNLVTFTGSSRVLFSD